MRGRKLDRKAEVREGSVTPVRIEKAVAGPGKEVRIVANSP